jgi:CDP-diacylglycerol--serine O-phosphatidyltransferase
VEKHGSGQAARHGGRDDYRYAGGDLNFKDQILGPKLGAKRPRRAAYVLPSLFTSGNIFLGFLAMLQSFEGAMQVSGGDYGLNQHFITAAKALGFAVFFDGLDGLSARMTNTTSDFGRELDSLADVITFGIAPAILAFVWGVSFVVQPADGQLISHLHRAGYLVAFFYLLCGAVRLARFNVQTNPTPKNPGRADRKYFVGMAIPAGAGFIAAVVYMFPSPVQSVGLSVAWLIIIGIVGLLMVSTWRYPSFKQIRISKPRTPLIVLIVGALVFLIWNWSQPVLLALASVYVVSGILIRLGGIIRRLRKPKPRASLPEHQIG